MCLEIKKRFYLFDLCVKEEIIVEIKYLELSDNTDRT